jgi:uncharacterized protein YjiS (DUF1127 family)
MRYRDACRYHQGGSFWLRLRLAFARRRDAGPPLADLARLDDHLLKDIGLFGSARRLTSREIGRESPRAPAEPPRGRPPG